MSSIEARVESTLGKFSANLAGLDAESARAYTEGVLSGMSTAAGEYVKSAMENEAVDANPEGSQEGDPEGSQETDNEDSKGEDG